MKKRSVLLAITCLALMVLATNTEAMTPAQANQVGLLLASVSTASPAPTLAPDTFDLNGGVTFQAPNGLFSIKLPKSWQPNADTANQLYTFDASGVTLSIGFSDISKFAGIIQLPSPPTSPRDLVEQLRKGASVSSSVTVSQVSSTRIGSLNGFGITVTTNKKPSQILDFRIASVTDNEIVVVQFEYGEQDSSTAKPFLEQVLGNLVIHPQYLPTNTPTPTPIPPLAFDDSQFSGIQQMMAPDGSAVFGDPLATVTILEFSDFSCPPCRDYQATTLKVIGKYVRAGQVKLVIRFVTFVGGASSEIATEAAICAGKQGHFLEMETALFNAQQPEGKTSFDVDVITALATKLKLNVDKLFSCIQDPTTLTALASYKSLADHYGVDLIPAMLYSLDGTPFSGIHNSLSDSLNSAVVAPPYDELANFLDGLQNPRKRSF